jgi:hypothetical protein
VIRPYYLPFDVSNRLRCVVTLMQSSKRTVGYHARVPAIPDDEIAAILRMLDDGEEPGEGLLARVLRRPACPGEVVERLATGARLPTSTRVLQLAARHPRCPQQFAWNILPRLGWHDLIEVARDPRARPAVRRQSERKLLERIASLTLGERTALARVAPRAVMAPLLAGGDPRCVAALLDNPQFTETEALRLLAANPDPACALVVLRHPTWGRRPEVAGAAVRAGAVPLGVALGVLPTLPIAQLQALAASPTAPAALRDAARALADDRRRGERTGRHRPGGGPAAT